MKKHKIILCALMCLCCVACEDKKQTPELPPSEIMIGGYRPVDIELSGDFNEIISLDINYDDVYIFGRTETGGYSGYLTDGSFSEYERMNFVPQTDETVKSSALVSFGKKAVLTYLDGKTMIYIYGKDGTQEKVLDCGEIIDSPDTPAEIFPLGRDYYIVNVNNQRLVQLQNDGSYVWDVEVDGDILNVSRGMDNTVICFYDNGNAKFTARVNPHSAAPTDMKKVDIPEVYASNTGEKFPCICVTAGGICGLEGSNVKKITDFTNMDFNPSDVRDIVETDSGYAVTLNDGGMAFITEENITELKTKKLIQVGILNNTTNIYNIIKTYNENNSDSDYKVELKKYSSIYKQDLQADILSGAAPDIIEMNNMNIDSFGSYEYFADLYPLIDNDPELSREDFMPNILSGFERGGRLLQLGNQFRIETIIAEKDSGIPENWTVDDMIEVYNNLPEDKSLFNFNNINLRETNFSVMFDESMYVDYGKKECYFDSPEFIKYLKFFQENEIGLTFDEYMEYQENVIKPFTEQKDMVITGMTNICTPEDIYYNSRSDFNIWAGYVGNGTTGGSVIAVNNTFAISADSPNIDASWDFLRTMYTAEKDNNITIYYFPVKIKDFEEQLKVFTRDNAYVNYETGKTVIEKRRDSQENELENFTPEEYEYYRDKVMSLRVRTIDNTVSSIVNEESFKYFSGNTTAEKTAEAIQKRVTEYLNG